MGNSFYCYEDNTEYKCRSRWGDYSESSCQVEKRCTHLEDSAGCPRARMFSSAMSSKLETMNK